MLAEFDVVKVKGHNRHWVAINVTKADLEDGIFCEREGLFLFGGFWWGEDPYTHRSFGKVIDPMEYDIEIKGKINDFGIEKLKSMCN